MCMNVKILCFGCKKYEKVDVDWMFFIDDE